MANIEVCKLAATQKSVISYIAVPVVAGMREPQNHARATKWAGAPAIHTAAAVISFAAAATALQLSCYVQLAPMS